MDDLHGYTPKEFHPPKLIIKDFLNEFGKKIPKPHELSHDRREACYKLMNGSVNLAQFEHLEKECSIKLNMNDEDSVDVTYLNRKPDCFTVQDIESSNLQTHKALKERKEDITPHLKYKGVIWGNSPNPGKTNMRPGEDVVLTIRVFRPFEFQRGVRFHQPPIMQQELLFLGRQSLCDLKDAIKCESDGPLMKETSENPSQKSTILAKDVYKSGFLFVDGIFYNDHRCAENIDYSAVIREWAHGRKLEFNTAKMEEHTFLDLSIVFGHPYVYQHQGDCEHLIVFSDIRLLSGNDDLCSSNYPILQSMRRMKSKMCIVCGKRRATWLTKQNERLFVETGYFCEECFISFNYIDGKKVGNFLAYPLNQFSS